MTPHTFYMTRCQRRLSQSALATMLNVSRLTINRWENGHTPLPADIADRLDIAFGLMPAQTAKD